MKKALFVLALFFFCIASSQNALAKPARTVKAAKAPNAGLGLNELGVEAGFVDPEGASGTIGFGAFAELGTLAQDIRLSSHLDYWSKSDNGFGAEASLRDISIGARAKYMFHVASPKIQPYAGAGLGIHLFHSKVVVPDMDLGGGFIVPGFTASDSVTRLGLDLGGGAVTPLNPATNLFVDLWYTVADIDQLSMKAGVSWRLNR
jgi:opacity protein-like surface antigen